MPDSQSPTPKTESTTNGQKQETQQPLMPPAPAVRRKRQARFFTFDQGLSHREQSSNGANHATLDGTSTSLSSQIANPRPVAYEPIAEDKIGQLLYANQPLGLNTNDAINNVADLELFQKRQRTGAPTADSTRDECQLMPVYDKNLAPTFYKPFLLKLFAVLAANNYLESIFAEKPEYQFILTGSTAKQLQDSSQRNPNDIDILCKGDLQQKLFMFKKVLCTIDGVDTNISDDNSGNLVISYEKTSFKLQLIDRKNSAHCFPAIETVVIKDGIVMLDAAVIPIPEVERTLADDNPNLLIELDSPVECDSFYNLFSPK